MKYPFTKYGYYDYIKDPIRQFFIKLKVLKGIDIWQWDMVNAHEVIFAQFKYFCDNDQFYFINQYVLEYDGCKYLSNSTDTPIEDIRENRADKFNALLRLHEIQLNNALLDIKQFFL